jgi:small GTP-binding protein
MNGVTYKTTLIGASTTGKTSIVNRMKYGYFNMTSECTIGASFAKIKHSDVIYELWDTAGQERYLSLSPMYFKGSKIIVFVFDVSEPESLNVINKYIKSLDIIDDYKIIFIGNKTDLISEKEMIDINDILKITLENLPIANKIYDHVLISTKTGDNFDVMMEKLYQCAKSQKGSDFPRITGFQLNDTEPEKKECAC